jgi:autotransporter-associated beta strand protein
MFNRKNKASAIALASFAATSFLATSAHAYITIGDFENNNNEGFFDWTISQGGGDNSNNPGADPTAYLPAPYYTYSSEGATLGSSALAATLVPPPPGQSSGYYQGLALKTYQQNDTLGNSETVDAVDNKFLEMDVTYNTAEWTGASYANLGLIVNWASAGGANSGFTTLTPTGADGNGLPTYDTSNPTGPGGWDPTDYAGTTTRTLIWDYSDFVPSGSNETLGQLIGSNPEYLEFIFLSSTNASNATWHFDNIRLSTNQVNATWTNSAGPIGGSGSTYAWGNYTNWTNTASETTAGGNTALPSNPGDIVNFNTYNIGAPVTIALNQTEEFQVVLGTMNFDSNYSYTIEQGSGNYPLTLNGNTSTLTFNQNWGQEAYTTVNSAADINDFLGNHTISAPVKLATNLNIAVGQASNTFTMSGNISGTGGVTLAGNSSATISALGTVVFSGSNSYTGGTTVNGGKLLVSANGALPSNEPLAIGAAGTVQLATGTGGETLSSLAITTGGTLDVGNNHVIINYGATDPKAAILGYLATGANAGAWNGTGIISSTAANLPGQNYGVGFADGADGIDTSLSSGQIEVAYVQYGDITLSGLVNANDFHILTTNFGHVVTGGWEDGDFTYSGTVNANDFHLLTENFGKTESGEDVSMSASDWAAVDSFAAANGLTVSSVPEPATLGLFGIVAAGVLARRRRST